MTEADEPRTRHSQAQPAELITDPNERAKLEVQNGLKQFDLTVRMIHDAIEKREFKRRPSAIMGLHREALAGISSTAGNYRPAGVTIHESKHDPPGAHRVPELVEDMCDYVNDRWDEEGSGIHLAAYVMWRLNWIHPFDDGNGRTSRATSYLVLCANMKSDPGGSPTIPDQISENRGPYYAALDAADAAYKEGRVDVSAMENLLKPMLAKQLLAAFRDAGGDVSAFEAGADGS